MKSKTKADLAEKMIQSSITYELKQIEYEKKKESQRRL